MSAVQSPSPVRRQAVRLLPLLERGRGGRVDEVDEDVDEVDGGRSGRWRSGFQEALLLLRERYRRSEKPPSVSKALACLSTASSADGNHRRP